MSVAGVLARSTRDAAALLSAMTEPEYSEPFFAASPPLDADGYLAAVGTDPGRLRIGRTLDTPVDNVVIDPEVLQAFDATSRLLGELGHDLVDIELVNPPGLVEAFKVVWASFAHATPLPPDAAPSLMPLTRYLLERGASVSGPELVRALGTVHSGGRAMVRSMAGVDAVLTPTVALLPPRVGYFTEEDPELDFERQLTFTPWTAQANLTGQPAISVPVQWTDTGLPVGMQLIGRSGTEPMLLALSGQLERARPWAHRTPPMW